MAHRFEKGKSIYFLFKNGYTVQDSQLKPRYYLERKKAKEYLPYGDEIVEYAPVVHGRWEICERPNCVDVYGHPYKDAICTNCGFGWNSPYSAIRYFKYCPNCGADLRGGDDGETV